MTNPATDESVKLAPLQFLEGDWQGEGHGPYGPYKLEAHVEQRGRWLLMTSSIFDAKSEEIMYVSTQVYGYDDDSLLLSFFDTAGAFDFRGKRSDDAVRFDWKEGENWKRSEYWSEADGSIRFRYESVFPKGSSELYEGRWVRQSAGSKAYSSRDTRTSAHI